MEWRGEPARVQLCKSGVVRPTGDGAALSDVDRNLVLAELLQKVFRGRDADTLDPFRVRTQDELGPVAQERDRTFLPFDDRTVHRDVERNRRSRRVGRSRAREVEDLHGGREPTTSEHAASMTAHQ